MGFNQTTQITASQRCSLHDTEQGTGGYDAGSKLSYKFPSGCHGKMIWVRAVDVSADANAQMSNLAFENVGPNGGLGATRVARTRSPGSSQPSIDPTSITSVAVTRPTLAPIPPTGVHCGICRAIEVPQRHYRSAPLSPDPVYENGEIVNFSKGGGCGVPIIDASEYRLSDLVRGDDLMFANTTVSTFSVRIEWPGYKMWSGQFRARSWSGTNEPVTRSRLAMQIAKRVIEFLETVEDVESTDMVWKVGQGHIRPKDLVLVSLVQVSKGSWQPMLRLLA